MDEPSQTKLDSWKFRRLFMLWQMVFCNIIVGYTVYNNSEARIAETALDFSFVLMGTIILAYVFGATWEDITKAKLRK